MSGLPKTLEKIIDSFSRLPGIGKKTAQRLGMHLIKMDPDFIAYVDKNGKPHAEVIEIKPENQTLVEKAKGRMNQGQLIDCINR